MSAVAGAHLEPPDARGGGRGMPAEPSYECPECGADLVIDESGATCPECGWHVDGSELGDLE